MKKKKKDKYTGIPLIAVLIFLGIFILSIKAVGADASWDINAEGGVLYDSITYEHYLGSSGTVDSSGTHCTTCTGVDTTLTISDSLYHFYYLYFYAVGDTNPGSWAWFKQPSSSDGAPTSIVFPLRAYWPDSASAVTERRKSYNGTGVTANTSTALSGAYYSDSNDITLNTAQLHLIDLVMDFPGVDSSVTWGFQIEPTSLASGSGITIPTGQDLVNVYGWLQDASGNPIYGAKVFANRVTSRFGLGDDTLSADVIVPNTTVSTTTDTLGLFQITIRRTGSYSDTTKGFYNFNATYNGSEMFSIERMYIPDVDSLSMSDTLANR